MRRGRFFGVLVLAFIAVALPWPAGAETRIALVIGNGAYPSGPLSSPKYDAKAVEDKLKDLGFQVTRKTDLSRRDFLNSIREFGNRLQQTGTVSLFYYSGHGMQVNNRNYMIPIDADIRSEHDVVNYAVPIEDILVRMAMGPTNLNIVILDACRNNPYEKLIKDYQTGLAKMESPRGVLIGFAAEPGKVAKAGSGGKLSMYTQALVDHIAQPYPSLIHMFQAVTDDVSARSGGEQYPRYENSARLALEFSFRPMTSATSRPLPEPTPAPPPPPEPDAYPPPSTVLFSDDFENEASLRQWKMHEPGPGTGTGAMDRIVVDGNAVLRGQGHYHAKPVIRPSEKPNVWQTHMRVRVGRQTGGANINLTLAPGKRRVTVELDFEERRLAVWEQQDGSLLGEKSSHLDNTSAWKDLAITVSGRSLSVSLDGRPALDYLLAGRVPLDITSFNLENWSGTVLFDNVRISKL